jgi:alpha-tubulin suppressor-like RCC1 family protein
VDRSSPVQIGSNTNWSKVSAGKTHFVALTTTGEIYAWGNLDSGQGNNDLGGTVRRSSPVQIGALTSWTDIEASQFSVYGAIGV